MPKLTLTEEFIQEINKREREVIQETNERIRNHIERMWNSNNSSPPSIPNDNDGDIEEILEEWIYRPTRAEKQSLGTLRQGQTRRSPRERNMSYVERYNHARGNQERKKERLSHHSEVYYRDEEISLDNIRIANKINQESLEVESKLNLSNLIENLNHERIKNRKRKLELENEEILEEKSLSCRQREVIIKKINDSFTFAPDGSNENSVIRSFISKYAKNNDIVKIERKSLEDRNYDKNEHYKIITQVEERGREKRYLAKSLIAKKENDLTLIPINDINWDYIIYRIAKRHLDIETINAILNPTKGNYKLVEIPNIFNYAYELEGGFESSPDFDAINYLGFNIVRDASVSTGAYARDEQEIVVDGYERGNRILEKTKDLFDELRYGDFITNDTCGIHIHISKYNNEWKPNDLIKISRLFTGIEKEIFRFLPNHRLDGRYSTPMQKKNPGFNAFVQQSPIVLDSIIEEHEDVKNLLGYAWYNSKTYSHATRDKYHSSRYVAFNMHSFFYRGTLEFRHFDADYKMLPYYLEFIGKLAKYALESNLDEIDHFVESVKSNPENMFRMINMSSITTDIIVQRAKDYFNEDRFENKYNELIG